MRLIFTIFLIFSFLGIAVFGFAAMHRGMEHGHHGCIAMTANGLICLEGSLFNSAILHLDTFKSFSTAVFTNNLMVILLALALIALAAIFNGRLFSVSPPVQSPLLYSEKTAEFGFSPSLRKLVYWLSLHENSPAL